MRCFIAIDIDDQIRDELKELIVELKDSIAARKDEIRWVKAEAVHLTLKFLGDVKDEDLPKICQITQKVAEKYKHFNIELSEVGSFGEPPRVIWVGINDETGNLTKMADELDDQLSKVGIAKEGRKFTPHLTICRIKSFKAGRNAEDAIPDYGDYQGSDLNVEAVCVYESRLDEKGPEYTVISKIELK